MHPGDERDREKALARQRDSANAPADEVSWAECFALFGAVVSLVGCALQSPFLALPLGSGIALWSVRIVLGTAGPKRVIALGGLVIAAGLLVRFVSGMIPR